MSTATPAQHGMWLTESLGLAATAYHMPLPVWLDGPLDQARLADAVAAAVARHPVLSCAFAEDDGELRLVPAARTPSLQVGVAPVDLATFVRERTLAPFDLAEGPLIRFDLVPAEPDRHLLLIVAHHLVFDGESKEILLADLATAYSTAAPAVACPAGHESLSGGVEGSGWGRRCRRRRVSTGRRTALRVSQACRGCAGAPRPARRPVWSCRSPSTRRSGAPPRSWPRRRSKWCSPGCSRCSTGTATRLPWSASTSAPGPPTGTTGWGCSSTNCPSACPRPTRPARPALPPPAGAWRRCGGCCGRPTRCAPCRCPGPCPGWPRVPRSRRCRSATAAGPGPRRSSPGSA
ncbi:condensation domain-containing protein [Catellatospora coxensis]